MGEQERIDGTETDPEDGDCVDWGPQRRSLLSILATEPRNLNMFGFVNSRSWFVGVFAREEEGSRGT